MTAQIIAFPHFPDGKKSIDSEAELVGWLAKNSPQSTRGNPLRAGKLLWGELQAVDKRKKLQGAVDQVCRSMHNNSCARQQIQNCLRVRYSVESVDAIPADKLDDAIELVSKMEKAAGEFNRAVYEMRGAFTRKVLGDGEPWTPWVRRKLGRSPGERPDWRALANEIRGRNLPAKAQEG